MTSIRLCFGLLLVSVVTADNFCRTQSDFNPNSVATGSTTCSALSTYLLGKVSGSPSTWSAVTCNQVYDTSWQDGGSTSEIKNIAEHLYTYGATCCGSVYKSLLGTTCYGCTNVAVGDTTNSMGWFTPSGSTTASVVSPGTTATGAGSFCSIKPPSTANQGTCNVSSWTNKKHGDTTAAAPYSTCDTCTVMISTTTYSTCNAYCAAQQGGLTCAGAWDEVLDSCIKKEVNGASPLTCSSAYSFSSNDIMCKCCPASGCPAATSGSSRSSSADLIVSVAVGIAVAIVGA